ncbi:hypothetical protein [Paenibacillus gansuensis]|uniref:DUF11 domain-containing protein n=1 Tax=Paenibacillus gansuensis TaxID=306542 RepID=A0ABW5PBM1_9BACL
MKSASTTNGSVGSTVTYTLRLANTGSFGASVTLTDNIPAGTSYAAGSFRVNGTPVAGANPAAGVNLGLFAAGGTSTVTFSVLINSLPSPPQLVNSATAAYTYQPPDGRTFSSTAASNTVTLPVRLPSVRAVKSASVSSAVVGDNITYTIVIANYKELSGYSTYPDAPNRE